VVKLGTLSFEVQELPDVVRLVILISVKRGEHLTKHQLLQKIKEYSDHKIAIEETDLEGALNEMASEKIVNFDNGVFALTDEGARLSRHWKNLLTKREPILEFITGLADGTITSLVVILSALLASLPTRTMLWTALLGLSAVSITNFSSFMLGSKTEDTADALSFRALMEYSVNDISDKVDRTKSLSIVKDLFSILRRRRTETNLRAALICSITTFSVGILPIVVFSILPIPFSVFFSFGVIGAMSGILVRYRSKKSKVHWKTTLMETLAIIIIAVVASLILGNI
jgi:DNA-binding PadR family transcriptional regulator